MGTPCARQVLLLICLPVLLAGPGEVNALDDSAAQDDFLLDISSAFVSAAVDQTVERTEPVADVILKTRISGTGRTVGKTGARLVANNQFAVVELVTSGTTTTETVGVNGPVRLYSDSTIPFQILQRVFITPDGVRADGVCARAQTQSVLNGIATDLHCILDRIVRKAACKKYWKNKEEADEIASRHAEERLYASSQGEAAPLLKDADEALKKNLTELRDKGIPLTSLRFSSSEEFVMVRARVAAATAAHAPPALPEKPYLALRIQETAATEVARVNLAGKTYTGEQIEKQSKKLGPGTAPKQPDDQDFTITFVKDKPLEITFADNGLRAVLRLAQFTSGDNEYSGMDMTVKYRFEPAGSKVKAVRQGPIEAFPPGFKAGQKLSARQQAMRTVLQKRFAKVFKEEIVLTDMELPKELQKAGPLEASRAVGKDGWLLITWRRTAP
jgi:hypothetical protein